nr:reverse transcriptase domain-containing protein [Tanacetum cinerariifolium]
MSEPSELNLCPSTSAVRNTVGKGNEQISKNPNRLAFDAALLEYRDKHYHQLLPITAEKVHQEKVQQEKLKEVKARLNFEGCSKRNSKVREVSQHSKSKTPNSRPGTGREKGEEGTDEYSIGWEELGHGGQKCSLKVKIVNETRMPSNVKTYDGSDDPKDHLKIFQATVKVEHWEMPTWCHMFNSTLTESAKKVARQRITQSFSLNLKISFPPLGDDDKTEGPMIIEAEIGVPSTAHGMLKFPVPRGILTLQSNMIIPLECIMVSGPKAQPSAITQAAKERIKVAIHPEYPEQTVAIGSTLTEEGRKA